MEGSVQWTDSSKSSDSEHGTDIYICAGNATSSGFAGLAYGELSMQLC